LKKKLKDPDVPRKTGKKRKIRVGYRTEGLTPFRNTLGGGVKQEGKRKMRKKKRKKKKKGVKEYRAAQTGITVNADAAKQNPKSGT